VSADFSSVSICDFGSAIDNQESAEMVTPYLVSRFYRAPEIILGLIPTYAIDLWGVAVTVAELFVGKVIFNGSDNNDMLKMMMEFLGPFSNRLIRQHLVQAKKIPIENALQSGSNHVCVSTGDGRPCHGPSSPQSRLSANFHAFSTVEDSESQINPRQSHKRTTFL